MYCSIVKLGWSAVINCCFVLLITQYPRVVFKYYISTLFQMVD